MTAQEIAAALEAAAFEAAAKADTPLWLEKLYDTPSKPTPPATPLTAGQLAQDLAAKYWDALVQTGSSLDTKNREALEAALALPQSTVLEQWARRDALLAGLPPLLVPTLGVAPEMAQVEAAATFMLTIGQSIAQQTLTTHYRLVAEAYQRAFAAGVASVQNGYGYAGAYGTNLMTGGAEPPALTGSELGGYITTDGAPQYSLEKAQRVQSEFVPKDKRATLNAPEIP